MFRGRTISIKLSALHPRYESRQSRERVLSELAAHSKPTSLHLLSKRMSASALTLKKWNRLELSLETVRKSFNRSGVCKELAVYFV